MGLTRKRRVFVEEYLKCWNGAEAARRAGYAHPRIQASNLLTNINIQEAIKKRVEELKMDADEILMRLAEQARGDHSKYMTQFGPDVKQLIKDNKAHLIKKWTHTANGVTIEFYDSQSALQLLGRALGMFTDKHEVTGADGKELTIRVVYDTEIGYDAEASNIDAEAKGDK